MTRILFLCVVGCLTFQLNAQQDIIPHFPSISELEKMDSLIYERNRGARSIPQPPPGPVRTMAEWEEVQALIITWAGQNTILREIVRHASKECKVFILTNNPSNVTSQLNSADISLDSVRFIETPFNSIWVRDYGPWTVYQNDVDSLLIIDWIYNRPRPSDDNTPAAIAAYLDLPFYEATAAPDDWVHTGGNHLPDGMGTAFSSHLVLEENPDKTEAEIDSIASKYLGVTQYIKFPTLPYDGIHHLDMHMRILDEETIMFGEYPEGVADGPQINENIAELLDEFKTPFGNDYRIIRIPMPPDGGDDYPDQGGDYRTYTNSIFINKTILVPVYEEKYDTTALRIYRESLPGYNVVGIDCNSIIPSLGALHCITKLVGVEAPLRIAHARLRDSDDPEASYPVSAIIQHRDGIEEASLYYRIKGESSFVQVPMNLTDTLHDVWNGVIPSFGAGSVVQYYIHAKAFNGKQQVRPIVAPEGYFEFIINGNIPPAVSIISPSDGQILQLEDIGTDISVDAADADGNVNEVVIYIDGDSTAVLTASPFVYSWTFSGSGNFNIQAKARDDLGATAFSNIINITVEETTSIDQTGSNAPKVYPNPVVDILTFEYSGHVDQLQTFDLYGRPMPVDIEIQDKAIQLNFSDVPSGLYFLTWMEHNRRQRLSIVKM